MGKNRKDPHQRKHPYPLPSCSRANNDHQESDEGEVSSTSTSQRYYWHRSSGQGTIISSSAPKKKKVVYKATWVNSWRGREIRYLPEEVDASDDDSESEIPSVQQGTCAVAELEEEESGLVQGQDIVQAPTFDMISVGRPMIDPFDSSESEEDEDDEDNNDDYQSENHGHSESDHDSESDVVPDSSENNEDNSPDEPNYGESEDSDPDNDINRGDANNPYNNDNNEDDANGPNSNDNNEDDANDPNSNDNNEGNANDPTHADEIDDEGARNVQVKRKRNRKPDQSKWTATINKQNRWQGKSYTGHSTIRNEKGEKMKIKKPVNAKSMGDPCTSVKCPRECNKFTMSDREEIFQDYWVNKIRPEQKISAIQGWVIETPKKSNRVTKKKESFRYYLPLRRKNVQVCRKMFLNTLGLQSTTVWNYKQKQKSPKSEERIYRRKNKMPALIQRFRKKNEGLKQFFDSLEILPSHYCRARSDRKYVQPNFTRKVQLYTYYKIYCKDHTLESASDCKFYETMNEHNIHIYKPKKDQCDICVSKGLDNLRADDRLYLDHIARKTAAYEEKTLDKERAINGEIYCIQMDLQSVILSPNTNAGAMYYKSRLVVHNLTIYNLGNGEGTCNIWDETQGGLEASVFASCLISYIENKFNDSLPIVVYTDGCTYQNRNAALTSGLIELTIRKEKSILQKYLEKGHTYMEADSMHSRIGNKLKQMQIHHPDDIVKACKEARNEKPYEVITLSYTFFKNYASEPHMRYTNIRPGESKKGEPTVNQMRAIQYKTNGKLDFKLNLKEDWKLFPREPLEVLPEPFPPLYESPIPMTYRKHVDLLGLLQVIKKQHWKFYENLPHQAKPKKPAKLGEMLPD